MTRRRLIAAVGIALAAAAVGTFAVIASGVFTTGVPGSVDVACVDIDEHNCDHVADVVYVASSRGDPARSSRYADVRTLCVIPGRYTFTASSVGA